MMTVEQDNLLFFGYYTVNTPYEHEFHILETCFQSFGFKYEYTPVKTRGNWQKNTQMKAEVVADFLARYPGRRLVYMDVDSIILSRPDMLWTLNGEMGAVVFHNTELLSGVVLFDSNEDVRDCVDYWLELNKRYPVTLPNGKEAWDQRTLHMAIQEMRVGFHELPPAYNYITDLSAKWYPGVTPIILATRGAFRFKQAINAGEGR